MRFSICVFFSYWVRTRRRGEERASFSFWISKRFHFSYVVWGVLIVAWALELKFVVTRQFSHRTTKRCQRLFLVYKRWGFFISIYASYEIVRFKLQGITFVGTKSQIHCNLHWRWILFIWIWSRVFHVLTLLKSF